MDIAPSEGAQAHATAMAVREFVAPLEPSGSLDAGRAMLLEEDALTLGARLHARIQKRLLQEDPAHRTERSVQGALDRPGFTCLVRGRIDVLLQGEPLLVEEIKTTFRPTALLQALAGEDAHPFALQARMYAWLLWRETGSVPRCRLRVVGLVDEDETLVELPFDPEAFSGWVEERLQALQAAFLKALARAAERRTLGGELTFPFGEPRPGQVELVSRVEGALRARQRLLLQAPTGLGKTAAILFPALRLALQDNLQVFYGTPRNSQHEVAEDCIRRMRAGVRSVTIRAKERVCPQPEVNCRPEVCPRANLYFDRLKESGALETVAALGCATSAAIARVADAHELCPFELALDAARHADVVIGDYNYAFSPNATLQRLFGTPEAAARMLVLVDEAHNLPARAADWFSPCLEVAWLEDLKRQKHHPTDMKVGGPPARKVRSDRTHAFGPHTPNAMPGRSPDMASSRSLRTRVNAQLKRCLLLLQSFEGPHRTVELEPQAFFLEEHRIGRLLTAAAAAGQELPPSHPLLALHHGWSAFCEVLRVLGEEHGLTWQPPGRLQITCADASEHLAQRMEAVAGAVLFSGTLKPFECHRRLSGLGSLETAAAEVRSPFPEAHRLVLVVPQISTLYRLRDREVPRIAHFLHRVLPLRHGNYFVFFSSFDMLEKTLPHLDLPGFRILAQPRRASQEQLQELLSALRTEQGVVVLAVQGGSLSEGIDCPGEALIGCVVVGPPLPRFDLEREHVRQHFQRKYGQGHQYAYTFPAAAKAVQAAGRVIRTPQDKGLLIFMDGRFLEDDYASCFPEGWFTASPRELVSEAILRDVQAFWER